MNWTEEIIIVAIIVILYSIWKRSSHISTGSAVAHPASNAQASEPSTPA
jgi:hypothetical protein